MAVCKLQRFCYSAFETLGSTGLFEGVGSNPTVRRYIADLKPQIKVDFAERSKAPVSGRCLSFFDFFCIFFVRSTRPRLFETNGQGTRARRSRTRRLISPCGVLTAPGEASVLVSSAPSDPGEKAPQISSPRVNAVDRAENTR